MYVSIVYYLPQDFFHYSLFNPNELWKPYIVSLEKNVFLRPAKELKLSEVLIDDHLCWSRHNTRTYIN